MLKFLKIALMSIILTIGLSGCNSDSIKVDNGPKKGAQAYMDAAIANDLDRLMTTLNLGKANEAEKLMVKGKLKVGLEVSAKNAADRGGYEKYQITDVKEQGNAASLKIKTFYKNGAVDVTDLTLEKVNDVWLVNLK